MAAGAERDRALHAEAEAGEALRHQQETAAHVMTDARLAREQVRPCTPANSAKCSAIFANFGQL